MIKIITFVVDIVIGVIILTLIIGTIAALLSVFIPSQEYTLHVGENLAGLDTQLDVEIKEQLLILNK